MEPYHKGKLQSQIEICWHVIIERRAAALARAAYPALTPQQTGAPSLSHSLLQSQTSLH